MHFCVSGSIKREKRKTKKGGTKKSNESMSLDIIPNLRSESTMAAISSGMDYGVNVIFVLFCGLWEIKLVGKGPSFNLNEGPKSRKSKWYYADKEKGPRYHVERNFLSVHWICM